MVLTPSLGDIASAAKISRSIYKALSDSMGSSYEYQCLIEELRSFERALTMVDFTIATTPAGGHLTQTIANETTTCLALLNAFLDNIKSYQKALGGGRKGAASWRKIGWGLLKADDVARFREKLSQHKQNINIFLTSLGIIVVGFYADETRQISASVNEVLALQKRLPRSAGYGDGNLVTLINPFGEKIPLLWEGCFSQDRLHETLMTYFKGKCGEGHVERHDYRIATEDGKLLVQSNNWGSVVEKGKVLVMSMVVKKVALDDEKYAQRQRNVCPHCYETQIGVMQDEGWLKCRRCEKQFGSAEQVIEESQPPHGEENIAVFQNLHLVLVKQNPPVRRTFGTFRIRNDWKGWRQDFMYAQAKEANRFVEIS